MLASQVTALLGRVHRAKHSRYSGITQLADCPILSGADFAAEVEAHPPFGRFQLDPEPFIRAGLASAGLPRPTPIAWTRADLDSEAELGARALRRAGLAARARSSDCLEGGLVAPGTLAISDALDALDAVALPVGPVTTDAALQRAAQVWDIVHPSTLIVDAPSLAFLSSAVSYPRPRVFVALLTVNDAAALVTPAREDVFRIFSVPQISSFAASECAAHDGYHLAEDAVLAEIVDDRLLLTTLTRSLALLRFDTGLRASLDRSRCRCGDTHTRLRFRAF